MKTFFLLTLFILIPGAPCFAQKTRAPWETQARRFLQQNKSDQALAVINRFLAHQPKHSTALTLKGFALLQLDRSTEAATVSQRALKNGAGADAWALLAAASQRTANHALAWQAATKAAALGRVDAQVYEIGGRALLALGRNLSALSWLRHASRLAPDDQQARMALITALQATNQTREAAAQATAAMRQFGSHPELVGLAASTLLQLGNEEKAADLLSLLQALGKAKAEEIATLGDLRLRANQPNKALELYTKAEAMGHKGQAHQYRKALAWWHVGDLERATGIMAGLPDKSARIMVELGELRFALGRKKEALATFKQALKKDPEASAAQAGMGRCWLAMGKWQPAETAYRMLLSRAKRKVEAYQALAEIKQKQGDLQAALAYLRRARAASPANTNVIASLLRLERQLLK